METQDYSVIFKHIEQEFSKKDLEDVASVVHQCDMIDNLRKTIEYLQDDYLWETYSRS
jgi:hypothetical protein